jgi:hypothetical protein
VVDDSDDSSTTCGRVFCKDCVVQAHGGGAKARAHVQALQDDLTGTWCCLACEPPALLQKLQLALEQGECMHSNDATTGTGVSAASPRSVEIFRIVPCRSHKRECEKCLPKDERDSVFKELSEVCRRFEEAVQDELTEWNRSATNMTCG